MRLLCPVAYLLIYFLLLIAMKPEMSITNVQSPEMGLIGYVIEVKAGERTSIMQIFIQKEIVFRVFVSGVRVFHVGAGMKFNQLSHFFYLTETGA